MHSISSLAFGTTSALITTVVRAGGSGFALDFADAQWAVTPGQSAVLYDGEVCLGGGVIAAVDTPVPAPASAKN